MKQDWTDEELIEYWTLDETELSLLANKTGATRLGFAVLLKFFQLESRFPNSPEETPATAIAYLGKQLTIPARLFFEYAWHSRSIKYHRAQVREHFGFREVTIADTDVAVAWLIDKVLPYTIKYESQSEGILQYFRESKIEPPSDERIKRVLHSAQSIFEETLTSRIYKQLSPEAILRTLDLLEIKETNSLDQSGESQISTLAWLKTAPGSANLETVQNEINKLEILRGLELPDELFRDISPKIIQNYRRRLLVESLHEARRHPEPLIVMLLTSFCFLRQQEIADNLVELLIHLVHKIGIKAEKHVEKQIIGEIKRVAGKQSLLFRLAETALEHPDGVVREVVYPVVNEQTLRDLVKEFKSQGSTYRQQVYTVMRASYSHYYRRLALQILETLEFRSNNEPHRPVIEAVATILEFAGRKSRFYPLNEIIPIKGVIKKIWEAHIFETDERGRERIERNKYEIGVLQALREGLRCKEIWAVGANRYRNPDEDVPLDFEINRENYYAALAQPLLAENFIEKIKEQMETELNVLNETLPKNPDVHLQTKNGGHIALTPLDAQPEPLNLTRLKKIVAGRWGMTGLLDILKETDLRTDFTQFCKSPTGREKLSRSVLQRRLLLCLYGLGTNTGLKRVSGGSEGENYIDLQYVRRRFLNKENLRSAIASVVNAIFQIRQASLWGEGTTACASDSKKFGSWDQNLMTEWHVRYGGRGVMIYWHVEKKSTCIYSQLKTCSSSEVAAMIEGVLRHQTEMEVEKNYVDSHGQSEVAFAFCHLLGFQLLPRLKAIHKQKLYRPGTGKPEEYPNLQPILTRPINWELIRRQYDQMVKYATALRLGTAETESILRRFTRNNLQHPTYKALAELGKAVKTIFLCRYLRLKSLRREIQEGLNVIENWNSANDFILFGKGGELATNNLDEQETIMLALHLLQISMV